MKKDAPPDLGKKSALQSPAEKEYVLAPVFQVFHQGMKKPVSQLLRGFFQRLIPAYSNLSYLYTGLLLTLFFVSTFY